MPKKLLLPQNVRAFCKALKERMNDTSTGLAKEYLRLLVDDIRVEGRTVRMRGSNGKLAQAAAQEIWAPRVPRFGYA